MIVAFTGHRPEGLGDDLAGAWISIKEYLMENRPDAVISGMAQGVDTFAFDVALELNIPITAAVPWVGFGSNWPADHRDQYMQRLEKAAKIVVTSDVTVYNPGVYYRRDMWMVDNSDLLVGVWSGIRSGGTWNTLEYARKMKKELKLLKWRAK